MAYQDHLPAWELGYPNEDDLQKFDRRRSRNGQIWAVIFALSTLVGVVALLALLISIVNNAFGYTAVVNEYDPDQLASWVTEQEMLGAPNTVASEDDRVLADGVAADPNAIGFFGYAYYADQAEHLRALTVNGEEPTAQTAKSGAYPLTRPLFVYSDPKAMEKKPQIAAFLDFYLRNVNQVIEEVGYFPAGEEEIQSSLDQLGELVGGADISESAGEDIITAGSSTVAPLTMRIAEEFKASTGFAGEVQTDVIGTKAGLQRLCVDRDIDIANASRAMVRQEYDACRRKPLEYRVGSDALAVVTSQENDFLTDVTEDQLQAIFTTAEKWSDVDPDWPAEPISRFIPGGDSGTLDFFVDEVYSDSRFEDLPTSSLILVLKNFLSPGRVAALDDEKPLAERTQRELLDVVEQEVVKPQIAESFSLFRSLFDRSGIEQEVSMIPGAAMQWRNWVSWEFITSPQSTDPSTAGVSTAILGSLWVVAIAMLFAIPLGIGAAVWLEEYADKTSWFATIVDTNINNLAAVPSIIYGLLGLAVFVRFLEPITSGAFFGVADAPRGLPTANGRTIFSAGLTLGLLILPLIIINSREALRAVPSSLREASYGMGATRWQTTWAHVIPNAITGMLTGSILAISRAIGETAPLVVVGASTFITTNPTNPFAKFTTLPTQIYQWTSRPQAEFQNLAAAASIVLLLLLLLLNSTAVFLRNRYSRRTV